MDYKKNNPSFYYTLLLVLYCIVLILASQICRWGREFVCQHVTITATNSRCVLLYLTQYFLVNGYSSSLLWTHT
jgi:hypothetical protein